MNMWIQRWSYYFQRSAFYEEERHAIMDCHFVLFHIKVGIVRHVELQNVAKTLMYQPHE
jgi:hypothetical protein